MKGLMFTELLGFIDHKAGAKLTEDLLDLADLPTGGAFARIGNYPAAHALKLIALVAEKTGIPASDLSSEYGEWVFERFLVLYPDIIARYTTAESMLDHVGSHIHEEVVILYPDAKPPQVRTHRSNGDLVVEYSSHRPLAHVAFGLIKGCLAHYGDTRSVEWIGNTEATSASFRITQK